MRDRELILRFLALYFDAEQYSRPMKGFLNNFMGRNKHLKVFSVGDIRSAFLPAIKVLHQSIGNRAFLFARVLNPAVFDAVMVGTARRLHRGPISDLDLLKRRYMTLLECPSFLEATGWATADEQRVAQRLGLATDAFADVR